MHYTWHNAPWEHRNVQNAQTTSVQGPTHIGKRGTRSPGNASHPETPIHLLDTRVDHSARGLGIRASKITMVHSDP